jgi:hypothetical protein
MAGTLLADISGTVNDTHVWFNLSNGNPVPAGGVCETGTVTLIGAGCAVLVFARRRLTKPVRLCAGERLFGPRLAHQAVADPAASNTPLVSALDRSTGHENGAPFRRRLVRPL